MESTEFTLEDCTRLLEIDTSGCCSRLRERETERPVWINLDERVRLAFFNGSVLLTHMPPEDPVQQATSGRLRRLIPVQIWRSRSLRPKHVQISETLSFYHLKGEDWRRDGVQEKT